MEKYLQMGKAKIAGNFRCKNGISHSIVDGFDLLAPQKVWSQLGNWGSDPLVNFLRVSSQRYPAIAGELETRVWIDTEMLGAITH